MNKVQFELNIILTTAWTVLGILALFGDQSISKITFGCCWACLLIKYIQNFILNKENKKNE